jgi:hypothetical protein
MAEGCRKFASVFKLHLRLLLLMMTSPISWLVASVATIVDVVEQE